MAGPPKAREFPALSNKLSAPPKKTVFERQRAEAEAKKAREEAETAAVYQDFVKSFENEEDDNGYGGRHQDRGMGGYGARGGLAGGSKRHFAPSGLKSGPGSLGPAPNAQSRKRAIDGSFTRPGQQRDRGILGFEDERADAKSAFQQAEEEDDYIQSPEDRAAPKPTVHLSSLPPGTSAAVIKALIPSNLHVDGVRLLSLTQTNDASERKSASAIVTLAKDTPASDIDAAVSSLQNQYLGLGFNLNISRHLSSAVLGSAGSAALPSSISSSHPFGAKPMFTALPHSLSRAPPPRAGFAPPSSYGPGAQVRGGPNANGPLQVLVKPPSDIKQIKLIHKTVEAVLTHGPDFEALLMSRSSVQRDEKWSWLWDARSPGGVWYRWRLWQVLSGQRSRNGSSSTAAQILFSGSTPWQPPEKNLRFEFTTDFDTFISDPDYDSSEEEASGDEADKSKPKGPESLEDTAPAEYLNPLQKAKFTHLLARLPTSTARLRKGDIARITAFAISHAGRGSEEVVNMLIDNVLQPFANTSANPEMKKDAAPQSDDDMDHDGLSRKGPSDRDDPSSATLIGLYAISDLLSSSSTSGVRHAWRYRQLFETALQKRSLFKSLGNLERDLGWGRLRAEKWRRAVSQLLQLWEGWCVFASAAHEGFVSEFETACEGEKKVEEDKATVERKMKSSSAWKSVEKNGEDPVRDGDGVGEDVDGEPMEEDGLDGEAREEDDDENLDGEPMVSSDEEAADQPMDTEEPNQPPAVDEVKQPEEVVDRHPVEAKRRRPRAVDMFADSDDEK